MPCYDVLSSANFWPGKDVFKVFGIRKLMVLVAVLVLLTLLTAPLVVAQQNAGVDPSEGGGSSDPALTDPVSVDLNNANNGFTQYAPSSPGGGQAVRVCPDPAAPGTANCHAIRLIP